MTVIMGAASKIFGILRVFRLVRALRPLRVINRAPGLKLVVQGRRQLPLWTDHSLTLARGLSVHEIFRRFYRADKVESMYYSRLGGLMEARHVQ